MGKCGCNDKAKVGACCGDKKPVKKAKQVTKDCCCDPCECCTCHDCNCDPCQCCQCSKTQKKGGNCGCGPKKVGGCASKKLRSKDCACGDHCDCCTCDDCNCNPCTCCKCSYTYEKKGSKPKTDDDEETTVTIIKGDLKIEIKTTKLSNSTVTKKGGCCGSKYCLLSFNMQ